MGKFSRDKGCREERHLVQQLIQLGYVDVKRVPLSGAARGFKFDVLATDPKSKWEFSFELKTGKDKFKWVYDFIARTGLRRMSYKDRMIGIGYTPEEAMSVGFDNPFVSVPEVEHKYAQRVLNLEKLKKDADFLSIRINNHHRLFLRFF